MGRIATVIALALLWFGFGAGDAVAAPRGAAARAAPPSDLSAQTRRVRRAPVRITVYPRYQLYPRGPVGYSGNRIDFFPRPYPYEWPGPFATRDCIAWLAAEARPSGPVVVPHRRCRWVSE